MLRAISVLAIMTACVGPAVWIGAESKSSLTVGSKMLNDIPVDAIGYQAPNRHYLASRLSTTTLDFIDDDHLLFTFHYRNLMNRSTQGTNSRQGGNSGEEEIVRATVINLSNNDIDVQNDWRMYDHGRYLWPLSDGRFLVRQGNKILMTSSDLQLDPLLEEDRPIVFFEVSPGGELLELQTRKPDNTVALQIIQRKNGSVIERADIAAPIDLPLSDDGILDAKAFGNNTWGIRTRSFFGGQREITRVISSCQPSLKALYTDKVLVTTCKDTEGNHVMQLYSVDGKKVWSMKWDKKEMWPSFAFSRAETYLAVSFLRTEGKPQEDDSDEDTTIGGQEVTLVDLSTGTPIARLSMTPVLSDERNFAISPSSHKFAILQGSAIKVFQIP